MLTSHINLPIKKALLKAQHYRVINSMGCVYLSNLPSAGEGELKSHWLALYPHYHLAIPI